jgi:5-methylcytosine-specific restriction protein B
MMTLTTNALRSTRKSTQIDHEAMFIAWMQAAMIENGVSVDQIEIANFYVALKSKPLTVLVGPPLSGKEAMAQCLAQMFNDQDRLHIQLLTGHPWWAGRDDQAASHTRLHTRFLTEKILAFIEEASQPGNTRLVFIACLIRMSPAELLSFFTDVAFQLQHGRIMRLGDTHFSEPIPFPTNLRIVGTMDTVRSRINW